MYAFVYSKPITPVSVIPASTADPSLDIHSTISPDPLHRLGTKSAIHEGNWAPESCTLALFSSSTQTKPLIPSHWRRRYLPTPSPPISSSKYGRRCLLHQVTRGLPPMPNRLALSSPQRQVRTSALPPLMWAEIPETGSTRDLLFAAIGAGCALLMSAAAAWAWHKEEMKVRHLDTCVIGATARQPRSVPQLVSSGAQIEENTCDEVF